MHKGEKEPILNRLKMAIFFISLEQSGLTQLCLNSSSLKKKKKKGGGGEPHNFAGSEVRRKV